MNIDTADRCVRLAVELRALGHRLDTIGGELLQLQADALSVAPAAGPQAGPSTPAGPYPVVPAGPYPTAAGAPGVDVRHPAGPAGGPPPAPPYWSGHGPAAPPDPPAVPRQPLVRPLSQLSGARLLAWTGGAVTLLGVVLLLALAASRGWFSPPARIGTGAGLGAGLIGLGCWLYRRPSARTGAVALAATGFTTLYLVLAAATAAYYYLDTVPALVSALIIAGGGLGLADRWRAQSLGAGVVIGAGLLAPVLVQDWRLIALVLALQLAALPVLLHRHWPVLMVLAAAGPVLYGATIGAEAAARAEPTAIAAVIGVLVVGVGTALLAAGSLPVRPVATLVAATPLPLLLSGAELDGWAGAALAALPVLVLGPFGYHVRADARLRPVVAAVLAVTLFHATLIALDGAALTVVVLGEALVVAVLAAALRSRFALVVSGFFALFGVSRALVEDAPLAALIDFPTAPYLPGTVGPLLVGAGVSVLVLALAVLLMIGAGRVGWVRPDAQTAPVWAPIGLVGLYGATSVVVTLALLCASSRTGFTTGHALVTVSWTIAALVLLARGISRPALRITGLVLVAAAVAKLVLFDLVALDGIIRVAAFLGAGLVLLAAGARYSRMVAEATEPPQR
ncbi:MAG TPA: DUF2339 domain-containing protein [Pseudonocardia sp.]|nr:DUF2339 domain-containing protein [Pseudonocardia sp.]